MIQEKSTQKLESLTVWSGRLRERRAYIDERIEQESKRPLPDFLMVQALKREKLRLKDELTLIEGVVRTVGQPEGPEAA
ncbi:MAG: YdcH family protein [Pseudomonadota bacterium]